MFTGKTFHNGPIGNSIENCPDAQYSVHFELFWSYFVRLQIQDEAMIEQFRGKWEELSEYAKEIKQGFSRFYNKRHSSRKAALHPQIGPRPAFEK